MARHPVTGDEKPDKQAELDLAEMVWYAADMITRNPPSPPPSAPEAGP